MPIDHCDVWTRDSCVERARHKLLINSFLGETKTSSTSETLLVSTPFYNNTCSIGQKIRFNVALTNKIIHLFIVPNIPRCNPSHGCQPFCLAISGAALMGWICRCPTSLRKKTSLSHLSRKPKQKCRRSSPKVQGFKKQFCFLPDF